MEFVKISNIYIKIGLHRWITLDVALKIYMIYYKSYVLQKLYFTIALRKWYG